MRLSAWMSLLLLLLFVPATIAQECTQLFEEALDIVADACNNIGRNQVCYGNDDLAAVPELNTVNFEFSEVGDIADLDLVRSLYLSPFDVDNMLWGVAVFKIQANLPDTLPGQNVTMIAFGDVSTENAVTLVAELPLIASNGVNVRSYPSATQDNVLASLSPGQEVIATGKLADNSWIRVRFAYDENTEIEGWVSADFLSGDTDSLNVIEPDAPLYRPMQAFYLTTGIGQMNCNDFPVDGVVIQVPEAAGQVDLLINGVELSIGSTVFIRSSEMDGLMQVFTFEGQVSVSADSVRQFVPPGTVTQIPLDAAGLATGTPQFPVPYDYDSLAALDAILALLPEPVSVPQALQPEEISVAVEEVAQEVSEANPGDIRLISGVYQFEPSCGTPAVTLPVILSEDGNTILFGNGPTTFIRTDTNLYTYINGDYLTITVTSSTSLILDDSSCASPLNLVQ